MSMLAPTSPQPLFRIARIPVSADVGLVLLVALIMVGWSEGGGPIGILSSVIVAVVAIASVLAHELGHALAVRRLGYGNSSIHLGMLGGLCVWRGRASHRDRLLIALAGPAVSLLLGGLGLAAWVAAGPAVAAFWPLRAALLGLTVLNLFWGVFNLLPIFPMDGGQALRFGLAMRLPWRKAVTGSLTVSLVSAVALAVWAATLGQLFAAVLVGYFAWRNWSELRAIRSPA